MLSSCDLLEIVYLWLLFGFVSSKIIYLICAASLTLALSEYIVYWLVNLISELTWLIVLIEAKGRFILPIWFEGTCCHNTLPFSEAIASASICSCWWVFSGILSHQLECSRIPSCLYLRWSICVIRVTSIFSFRSGSFRW